MKIQVKNIYKIFGNKPEAQLGKVKAGMGKEALLDETGHTLGLNDISLDIEEGQIFVIMGLSGSGKSTLIRHFNRLIEPTDGHIIINGQDVMALPERELEDFRRHKISMVFQRFGLLPHKSVLDNTAYGLQIQGVGKAERAEKAGYWLEQVGLKGFEEQYPHQLSGGMQQRVGLARALTTDPEILLMDEAFSALDPLIRREMQDQLLELQQKLHKTIVFITHDLDEALRLGDRIAILRDGELVQVGSPEEILLKPADDYVQAFVQDVNRARVLTASHVLAPAKLTVTLKSKPQQAVELLKEHSSEYACVLDGTQLKGLITVLDAQRALNDNADSLANYLSSVESVRSDTELEQILPNILSNNGAPIAVTGKDGGFKGWVSCEKLISLVA
ncbi:quaternary amine ABC transporter ATP-binding protein [Marinobacterium arenosum]|uniref:quaternary amine ABC transporter ATP-binding protein n=1 Tax=Marinobacterium arenosum TaxID=2862496 RepID=UPI001C95ACDC|nr:glycine betaine/L-proline ABC transporter ATP-binding protein [Marinobacterium arenosum]MBY4677607.1 glycine betaine/L-proline ABC transporter ATP-binding protein [Marinobacterium arenosum]